MLAATRSAHGVMEGGGSYVPSLAASISDAGRRLAFADGMEQRLKRHLCERPAPFHSFVQVMVLAKQAPAVTPPSRSNHRNEL